MHGNVDVKTFCGHQTFFSPFLFPFYSPVACPIKLSALIIWAGKLMALLSAFRNVLSATFRFPLSAPM
jgi:hypothetical protein